MEYASGPRETYADMKKKLPGSEPRYVVFDHEFKTKDGRTADKLLLIQWSPESSRPHLKTFYSSQKGTCCKDFMGVEDKFARTLGELEVALGLKAEEESDDEEWDPDA